MAKKTAVYPGTFDPVTYGHLDILERAASLFDHVILSVVKNSSKNTLFLVNERIEMAKEAASKWKNVSVESFDGLLVDYAKSKKASAIIRGLRVVSDFEYEFQMALTNRKIMPSIETVLLMPSEKYSYISSTFVRDIARYNGDVSHFVPSFVARKLKAKFKVPSFPGK